jgi:peroxiredoxin
MTRVQLDVPAPDFSIADFRGGIFHLADVRGRSNILLVFNRGFM